MSPTSELRDYEWVPLLEGGSVDALICREILHGGHSEAGEGHGRTAERDHDM